MAGLQIFRVFSASEVSIIDPSQNEWFPSKSQHSSNVKWIETLINPNRQKSYKISQRLSPKHAARGVVQSPYPTFLYLYIVATERLVCQNNSCGMQLGTLT